jgi:hypothetical protein
MTSDDDLFMTPYDVGVLDAEDGRLCLPEMYFARNSHKVEYALGYESVAGPTLLSAQVKHLYGRLVLEAA